MKTLFVFAIAVTSFAASYHLNVPNDTKSSQSAAVSLNHFTFYKVLGEGAAGKVFLAKKNGGSDDGTFYAIKAVEIPDSHEGLDTYYDSYMGERQMLEKGREWPWASSLHYLFLEGNHLFYVMDFAPGGDVEAKVKAIHPDAATIRKILVKIAVLVEKMHNAGFLHHDLGLKNVLIDQTGRFMLTDFACTSRINAGRKNEDWRYFSNMCTQMFSKPITDEIELSIEDTFYNMRDDGNLDEKVVEMKKHPYFNGIDWEKEAEDTDPVFEPTAIRINEDNPIDATKELKFNYLLDESIIERLSNLTFVAPEYQY